MYSDIIKQALIGCSDADAERIEDYMRDIIFHSTLDWQTREELMEAAQIAYVMLSSQKVKRYRKRPSPKASLSNASQRDKLQP